MPKRINGVTFSGPFFEKQPQKILQTNIHDMLDGLAKAGELQVKARMVGIGTGRTMGRVRGRVKSLAGKPWKYHAVVSPYTADLDAKEAISVRAAAAEIEQRRHPFARTASSLRAVRKNFDLSKGMN